MFLRSFDKSYNQIAPPSFEKGPHLIVLLFFRSFFLEVMTLYYYISVSTIEIILDSKRKSMLTVLVPKAFLNFSVVSGFAMELAISSDLEKFLVSKLVCV